MEPNPPNNNFFEYLAGLGVVGGFIASIFKARGLDKRLVKIENTIHPADDSKEPFVRRSQCGLLMAHGAGRIENIEKKVDQLGRSMMAVDKKLAVLVDRDKRSREGDYS